MKNVKTQELVAGMVTANAIRTRSGQVVVDSKTALTPQLINHLKFYRIDEVPILSEFDSIEDALNKTQPEILSYSDRIRSTIEYKHFKQTFSENVQFLSTQFNDVILKSDESRGHELLEQTTALFDALDDRVNIFEMLHCLRKTDVSTYTHSLNVAILCRLMGRWMHFSKEDVDTLTLCGLLHDIGKTKTPKNILLKPEKLTGEEFAVIKLHPLNGYEILKKLPLDSRIKRAALMHHERCDGTGYPLGLMQEEIDPFAVIVSIADVYDAMTTDRCYREAICPFTVIETFEKQGFHKYSSSYMSTFLNHVVDIYMDYHVVLNNGCCGQIVLKNQQCLARPTIYLPTKEFLDLSKHPELNIKEIM